MKAVRLILSNSGKLCTKWDATAAGEQARGPTKILKRDPSSDTASPHDHPPAIPSSQPPPQPDRAHSDVHRPFGQPPATQGAPPATSAVGSRAASPSGQTAAGAAAAAAAQAALAGPAPAAKQLPPRYNPPGTSSVPPPPAVDQAQPHISRPQPQQQQQPVSALEALATAGIHHPPPPAGSQDSSRAKFAPPNATPGAAPEQRASQQGYSQSSQARAGPQLPSSDPKPHLQHPGPHPAGLGPSPSQQITAQAARLDPHRAPVQQQGSGHGNGPLPQPMLQFGSVQHVPNNQSVLNPLHFGIPAGMLPGAKLDSAGQSSGAQPGTPQAQQGTPWTLTSSGWYQVSCVLYCAL